MKQDNLVQELSNMQQIIYRQLMPGDHDEYKRVRLECLWYFPDNFGTTYEEELDAAMLKLDNAIKKADAFNFAFGAFDANLLVGICGFVGETRLKTKHRGEIVQMYVDPKYKGGGIGKELLRLSVETAFSNEQIEQIILSAVAENEKALSLYKQMGFVEYGKLDNYFKSGKTSTAQSFFCLGRRTN